MTSPERFLLASERVLLAAGIILLVAFVAALVHRSLFSHMALQELEKATVAATPSTGRPTPVTTAQALNVRRQPALRLETGSGRLSAINEPPLAVLRLDKLGVRIPVFEGTSRLALNRGAGWIAGTSLPWEGGNIGIAGHRDSFFSVLKDVSAGDEIELSTVQGTAVYEVSEITIVSPNNVSVLGPRGVPRLTLVTCYPFNFIGAAPKRYIVSATLRQKSTTSFQDDSRTTPSR